MMRLATLLAFAGVFVATACVLAAAAEPGLCSGAGPNAERPVLVAFGPEENPEELILRLIDSAKASIRLSAFSFSSPPVVEALVRARQRGIDVAIVVDRKHNVDEDPKGIGQRALARVAGAGIAVRTNANYRILHDKFMVVDGRNVETGSYNFSASANRNSENVLLICDRPDLAARYADHWTRRFTEGADYRVPGK